ncbi:uncharacterized protein LOC116013065 [Ipomoea triloba]|uniref:uncharacterized protein LOC116013065 n=1 Tax=Ipomoea triloba TaxID=35885 RepID=UPI00125DBA02|nr:uncharacterized protein LOC116013065 [Ipomoea triloba]
MIDVASRLGYNNNFIVKPLDFAGGFLLFWKNDQIDLDIICHNSQAIHTRVKNGNSDRFITFAYVRPNMLAKCRLWENCRTFSSSIQGSWIVLDDFNDIASSEEQWGSSSVNSNLLQRFVDAYNGCGLMDPGTSGSKFTLCRFAGNRVFQMRRLDQMLWNVAAQLEFPEGKVVVLPRHFSDHNPIFFIEEAGRLPHINFLPFRFEAAWLSRNDYRTIWEDAIGGGDRPNEDVIRIVTQKSRNWNCNSFGNIFHQKRRLEAQIQEIQNALNFNSSDQIQRLERQLLDDLNVKMDQEESFWFQNLRVDWIRDGDRKTRFYHNFALIRRNKNRIKFLKIQDGWTDNPILLSAHIIDFFASLFCRSVEEGEANLIPIVDNYKIP